MLLVTIQLRLRLICLLKFTEYVWGESSNVWLLIQYTIDIPCTKSDIKIDLNEKSNW